MSLMLFPRKTDDHPYIVYLSQILSFITIFYNFAHFQNVKLKPNNCMLIFFDNMINNKLEVVFVDKGSYGDLLDINDISFLVQLVFNLVVSQREIQRVVIANLCLNFLNVLRIIGVIQRFPEVSRRVLNLEFVMLSSLKFVGLNKNIFTLR